MDKLFTKQNKDHEAEIHVTPMHYLVPQSFDHGSVSPLLP